MKKIVQKIKTSLKTYHPPKPLAMLFLLIPFFSFFIGKTNLGIDNDLWFILTTGRYILTQGFPLIEPFTIHENFAFVIQQWLTDVIFYRVFDLFGLIGISIFVMLIFVVILFIMYKLCKLISDNRVHLSVLITIVFGILYSFFYLTSRPQIFDALFLLLSFYFLELYIKKGKIKYLIGLPICSFLLINFHASSWFMLFLFILPYLLNFKIKLFSYDKYKIKPLLVTVVIMFLAGFLNPYGIRAIVYIFSSFGNRYINDLVIEMHIPNITSLTGIVIYASLFGILLCYVFYRKSKLKLRYLLLYLGTTVLALSSIKGFQFFLLACFFPLASYLKPNFKIYQENYHYSKQFKIRYVIIVLCLLSLLGVTFLDSSHEYKNRIENIKNYLVEHESNHKEELKIYTGYNDGGYLEFYGFKVYLDPRAEVFLKSNNKQKDVIEEYSKLQKGRVDIDQFLSEYNFDYLVLEETDYIYDQYLSKKDNKNYQYVMEEKRENSGKNDTMYLYKRSD